MKVQQLMKRSVRSCEANDSLHEAARIMWDNDCGCVPVRDGDGRLAGIITDRDVCMAAYLQGGPLHALRVGSAMSAEVAVCGPDDTLASAEMTMRQRQVRRLPVVDADRRVVGILSLSDLAGEAGREPERKKKEVSYAAVGETLRTVCTPRRGGALAAA